jgi:hypothetical protein
MSSGIRWTITARYGNSIYLTDERWKHIIEPLNHPEMVDYEEQLKDIIRSEQRRQDPLNPQKFRYTMAFDQLAEYNSHIVAIVLYRFREQGEEIVSNNYVVTASQKEIG